MSNLTQSTTAPSSNFPSSKPANPATTRHPARIPLALGLLVVRTALLLASWLGLRAWASANDTPFAHALVWQNLVIIGVDLVTLALIAAVAKRHLGAGSRDWLRRVYGAFGPVDLAWGLLVGVIVTIGFFAANLIANLTTYQGPPPIGATSAPAIPIWLALSSLLIMPITIALAEEGLYRGVSAELLRPRLGKWGTWLVVAAAFGLQHLFLTVDDPRAMLARFLTTFLAGLLFGALVRWSKKLWPVVIGHWLLDVLLLGLPMLALAQ